MAPKVIILKREAFKKKKCNIFYIGGGGSGPVFVTLFFSSKTWSKMAQYCTLKALFIFFLDFHYTFCKIGGGSDPNVKNVTLFFLMKASLIQIIKVFNFSDILRMKCSVPLFLLLHTRVILGDYCEPSCECEEEPLISVKCLNANLKVCSLKKNL